MAAMDLNDFTVIKEGEAEILMHSKNVVFYNKAQVNNRDMSIAVLRAFIAKRKQEHAARLSKKKKKKTGRADSEAAVSMSVEEEEEEEEEGGDEPAVKKTKVETDSEKDVSEPVVDEASAEPAVNGNCNGDCEMSEDVSLEESSSVTEEPSGIEQGKGHGELKPPKVLEALSASGLRALRYAREVEGIGQVVALDNDKASVEYGVALSKVVCSECGVALAGALGICTHLKKLDLQHFTTDEVDDVDHGSGGLSCCWSRTPRFREAKMPYDAESHPLLYKNVDDIALYDHKSLKLIGNEADSQLERPRSLSQKSRPKSFSDLVGQNVVARSLLGAISRGSITSFYIFHGLQGTGKTSASRIFAAALNCLSLEEYRPCGLCLECIQYLFGNSRDIKEINSVRINRIDRIRSHINNAARPPVSSRFKVFIIDECHLMRGETWVTLLSSIDNLSQHVVFIMITPDLDKLPRNAVSRSQRYHFPKIKDGDIASKLGKICVEEGIDFDHVALNFIAAKSNCSLRDAEMMLDQLSLLGKKIITCMVYELIGAVSDDELLELLDLALSSDTSSTVIRARELMGSRIDPMQLISQLANLIMDILAGQEGGSEVQKTFLCRHTSEMDIQKLSHALKIFSETEKQLRVSKNQTTWLTAALLQLSSVECSSSLDASASDTKSLRITQERGQSLKNLDPSSCNLNTSERSEMQKDIDEHLESIWKRVISLCQSKSFKTFLRKQGRLSSLFVNQGLAITELEFCQPDYVTKAEKSWKIIAGTYLLLDGSVVLNWN